MSAPSAQEWQAFRDRRDASLAAPHSVLAQVGLHWVEEGAGEQTVPGVPGTWELTGGRLVSRAPSDAFVVLAEPEQVTIEEADGLRTLTLLDPGDVQLGVTDAGVRLDVVRRGDRTGLRPLDPATPRRTGFTGVPVFPFDPSAVLEGVFRPDPGTVRVGSALPWLEQELPSPGTVTLDVDGATVTLRVTGEDTLIVTDETSGTETADWRQVPVKIDGERAEVDLNRALNFPSAFSAFGTCPRPPAGNHLPLAVRAGERRVEPTER